MTNTPSGLDGQQRKFQQWSAVWLVIAVIILVIVAWFLLHTDPSMRGPRP